MDTKTLIDAMSGEYPAPTLAVDYKALTNPFNAALVAAHCNTVARVAMFAAQVGAESGSLRWLEEIADGTAYEWRSDLGNTQAGDGRRFKGRGVLQVTGRHNYTRLSAWAYAQGEVPTKTYFVDHPDRLALPQYAFTGAVWYWTVARDMNAYADNRDIKGATYAVNGGLNNIEGRTARWNHALTLGRALLPNNTSWEFTVMDAATKKYLDEHFASLEAKFVGSDKKPHSVESTVAHVTQGANYLGGKGRRWFGLLRAKDAK